MATLTESHRPPLMAAHTIASDPRRAREGALGVVTGPIARSLYALPFLVFGVNHLLNTDQIAQMVPAWLGVPTFWAYLTGIAMIAAAVAIISAWMIVPATFGLAGMLLVFVATIHVPGVMNPDTMTMSMINGLKDFALAAAALMAIRAVGHGSPPSRT